MLNATQLASRIDNLVLDLESIDDFEDWFRSESRDVHLWGDEGLNDFVFSVESAFSDYHFADLDESRLKEELARIASPFALNIAENRYGDPSSLPTSESNAGFAVNCAAG